MVEQKMKNNFLKLSTVHLSFSTRWRNAAAVTVRNLSSQKSKCVKLHFIMLDLIAVKKCFQSLCPPSHFPKLSGGIFYVYARPILGPWPYVWHPWFKGWMPNTFSKNSTDTISEIILAQHSSKFILLKSKKLLERGISLYPCVCISCCDSLW